MTSPTRAFLLLTATSILAACAGGGEITGTGGGATSSSSSSTSTSSSSSSSTSTSSSSSSTSTSSSSTSASSSSSSGSPMPVGCVTDVSAGHHVFACDGITYDVEIPDACASGGCGLVLDMHGYTMNASQEDAGTNMRALGKQHGYVVVQPTAPLVTGWVQASHAPLVFSFVSDAATALATNAKRAHAMGFSQGGGMTWRMICEHADFFASAAPLAGLPGCEWMAPDAPSREVPTLQVHGHKDAVLNFNTYAIPERDAAIAFWKLGSPAVIEMDAGHKATRYLSPNGTPFEFWEHDYVAPNAFFGGHCFPGGSDVGPGLTQFGCMETGTFVVGQLAMDFFIAHPLP